MTKSISKRTFTQEHCEALSKGWEKRRQRPLTEAERAARERSHGIPRSEETRRKISNSLKGKTRVFTEAHKQHLKDAWTRKRERKAADEMAASIMEFVVHYTAN